MKIILIIIGILGWVFTMTLSYITGLLRGFKLMSKQNVEQKKWETSLIASYYKKDKDVDPFVKNKFVREQLDLQKINYAKRIEALKKTKREEIAQKEVKKTKKVAKKTKKGKKNAKK